jgi:hypothetical protein
MSKTRTFLPVSRSQESAYSSPVLCEQSVIDGCDGDDEAAAVFSRIDRRLTCTHRLPGFGNTGNAFGSNTSNAFGSTGTTTGTAFGGGGSGGGTSTCPCESLLHHRHPTIIISCISSVAGYRFQRFWTRKLELMVLSWLSVANACDAYPSVFSKAQI